MNVLIISVFRMKGCVQMGFKNSALSEIFKAIYTLSAKAKFSEAKKTVLDCIPPKELGFFKDFEKFPETVLPVNKAVEWITENISYGAEPVPSEFVKLNWNIAIGDDHVFYIDIECQDARNKAVKNMLNESMLVLETLTAEDYGLERLSAGYEAWCEENGEEIERLQFKGMDVNPRALYDSFAFTVLLEYVSKIQKALISNEKFKRIQFGHFISTLDDSGKRQSVA